MIPKRPLIPALMSVALVVACQPAPAPSPTKADKAPASTASPAPAKTDAVEPAVKPEPEPSVSEAGPPSWFDANAYEHAAIVRQDTNGSQLPTGKTSKMILLELPAKTTAEQCIEQAKAKLGQTIEDVGAPTTTPQGYLQLRGSATGYDYSVVCGVAKDKPTMFLSLNQ